jgi:hypothetical protein
MDPRVTFYYFIIIIFFFLECVLGGGEGEECGESDV